MTNSPGDPNDPYAQGPSQQPSQQPPYPPQTPYGQQPPYPPQGAYGQQPGYGGYAPDHPKATTSLILGILGLVVCGILAPFAWQMGKRTVSEIDASHGQLGGRGTAQAGYILGLIGTILLGLALLVAVGLVVLAVVGMMGSASYS